LSVPLSTIQISLTFVGLIVIRIGWVFARSMAQLSSSESDERHRLICLSRGLV
jgi:hypothetical protein